LACGLVNQEWFRQLVPTGLNEHVLVGQAFVNIFSRSVVFVCSNRGKHVRADWRSYPWLGQKLNFAAECQEYKNTFFDSLEEFGIGRIS
jgi:hypothetical protein